MELRYTLDDLVATYARATNAADGYPSSTHAGLAAVIHDLTDAARISAAQDYIRYDHRSLYEFCAALDYASSKNPVKSEHNGKNRNDAASHTLSD